MEKREATGQEAFMGVLAILSILLLALAVVYTWGRGWLVLLAFVSGVAFGWSFKGS